MKAMILAAGEGRRMRPLTLTTPKPLLQVKDKPLIVHHLLRLQQAGITDVVINIAYLGEQIKSALGDGKLFGVNIIYSEEPEPLETAGALLHAMRLFDDAPFVLINGDVWTDYPLSQLCDQPVSVAGGHLVLVPNPDFKASGDFTLDSKGVITQVGSGFTFSGMSKLSPQLIQGFPNIKRKLALREVFAWAITQRKLTGELYQGLWTDVGTPARLEALNG